MTITLTIIIIIINQQYRSIRFFSVPIIHWALVTGNLQKLSLFKFWVSCLSRYWNPIVIHIVTFKLSWLFNSKFHRLWSFNSFIKTDCSIHRSSVGVLLKLCVQKTPCCWTDGVYSLTYQWIRSASFLASKIAIAFCKAASSSFLVSVNF